MREAFERTARLLEETAPARLICFECGAGSIGMARGWRAEIADDPREDDPPYAAVYCPQCWEREFGW